MRPSIPCAVLIGVLLLAPPAAEAQDGGNQTAIIEGDWTRHMARATKALASGDHEEAVKEAQFAARLAGTYFETSDKRIAASLTLLGNALVAAGRPREAEQQFRLATLAENPIMIGSSGVSYRVPVNLTAGDSSSSSLDQCRQRLDDSKEIIEGLARWTTPEDLLTDEAQRILKVPPRPVQPSARPAEVQRRIDESILMIGLTRLAPIPSCLRTLGRPDDAERMLRRSLAIFNKMRDRSDNFARLAESTTRQLALLVFDQFRYAEAIALFRASAAGDSAEDLRTLGTMLADAGHYDEADACFARWAIVARNLGVFDRAYLGSLARLRLRQGYYAEAEDLALQDTDRKRGLAIGNLRSNGALPFADLGEVYRDQRDYAAAQRILGQALQLSGDATDSTAGRIHATSGDVHRALNNRIDAEVAYDRARAIYEALFGVSSPPYATVVGEMGYLRFLQGSRLQADELLTRALDTLQAVLGTKHPSVARVKWHLAELRQDQGKSAESDLLYKEAISIMRASFVVDRPALAPLLASYAAFLRSVNRGTEAAALEKQANALAALKVHTPGKAVCTTAGLPSPSLRMLPQ